MRPVTACLLLAAGLVASGWAQTDDAAFESFQQGEQQALDQYARRTAAEFEAWAEADRRAFERFRTEVERTWGEYVGSTRKDWVEYGDGLASRSRVDFETGTVTVEAVANGGAEEVRANLQEAVAQVVVDRGASSDYPVQLPDGQVDAPQPLGQAPVLAGQVAAADGTPVTPAAAGAFAREVVASGEVRTEEVVGDDGTHRLRAVVTFPLVPDHLRVRAETYRELVAAAAARFGLDPSLVFAVIHTESHFNPKARSPVPAYGLMQLVPTSGGREAYRHVHRKDEVLPPSYFYVPRQNIELGCGYLDYLRRRVFARVEDEEKARYCIVAAYNTGAGNVSRALTGKTAVSGALPVIARMPAPRLYAHLTEKLPYEETRRYLAAVIDRMSLYAP